MNATIMEATLPQFQTDQGRANNLLSGLRRRDRSERAIERTDHVVPVPHLPDALRGLRVVQLSDLHRSRITSDQILRHAVAVANAACPDLIILTGDYVTEDLADIEPCGDILSQLQAPLGCYAVLGNHDHKAGASAVKTMLARQGIEVLDNGSKRLQNGLWLVGLEDSWYGRPDPSRAFRDVRDGEPALVLSHNPVDAELASQHDCVIFSGHTHGGQIRLPLPTLRGIRSISTRNFRAGWFTLGKASLYINRGLGQVGLPLRFLCRPEVSVFTLVPAQQTQVSPQESGLLQRDLRMGLVPA